MIDNGQPKVKAPGVAFPGLSFCDINGSHCLFSLQLD